MEKGGADANDGKDGSTCTAGESGHSESFLRGTTFLEASSHEERHTAPSKDEMMESTNSDAQKRETIDDIEISDLGRAPDIALKKDVRPNPASSSVMSKYVEESFPIEEDPKTYHSEDTNSLETSVHPEQSIVNGQTDVPGLSGSVDEAKQMVRSCPENSVSNQFDDRPHSCSADTADATQPMTKSALQNNNNHKYDHEHSGLESSAWNNAKIDMSEKNCNLVDIGSPDHCKSTLDFRISAHGGTDVIFDSSSKEFRDPETCSLSVEDLGTDEARDDVSDEDDGSLGNNTDFYKRLRNSRSLDLTDKRTNIELDDGIVDPMEVALQVAIEVEREVIRGSEPSCSFSDKLSEGNKQPDIPESTEGRQRQPNNEYTPKEALSDSDQSYEALSDGKEIIATSGNLDVEPTKSLRKESSYITEVTQEPEGIKDKDICIFDLNQDLCTEEMEQTLNPISSLVTVSVSRAAAVPGLSVAPLQFEGTLGWKGFAATSAFRPASPREIHESGKALSSWGSHCSSKQNNFLDIDLNVAERVDDKVSDIKQILASFDQSSVEASPKTSERLNLDLNCVTDDCDVRAEWTADRQLGHHGNSHHNLSPLLSSSFLQPVRNIDLNEQPSVVTELTDHPNFSKASQNLSASGRLKSDGSVVSIMGMRMEVNQKDIPQASFLANGRIPESVVDVNLARPGPVWGMGSSLTYPHSPFHGFNSLAPRPPMPFSSTQYGPGGFIPYMTDSRGAPIVPQGMGSGSVIPHTSSQVPFMMAGFPSSNRTAPSQKTLDLNSGSMIDEGYQDTGGLRQFLNPGQSSSKGEHLANSQSSSVIGGKRKEPDSGWDSYQSNYKHYQPPWK